MTERFVHNQVLLTGVDGHERTASQIGRMGARDLIIAMATPRYSAATPEFVRLARGMGVPCIGLTDCAASPLAELCDECIFLPSGHSVLNNFQCLGDFILRDDLGAADRALSGRVAGRRADTPHLPLSLCRRPSALWPDVQGVLMSTTAVAAPPATIRVEDLSVNFRGDAGDFAAVKGLSFEIAPGETLAVVGGKRLGASR